MFVGRLESSRRHVATNTGSLFVRKLLSIEGARRRDIKRASLRMPAQLTDLYL